MGSVASEMKHALLDNLEPDRELDAPCDVEAVIVEAKEHGDVRVALGVLLLEGDVRDNILVFARGLGRLGTPAVRAKATKNLARLVEAAHLDEPPRGLYMTQW